MHRIGHGAVVTRWALPLATLIAAPLWAGSVTRVAADRVNVKAVGVPLGQFLRELAAVTPIPNLVIDPKLEQQAVTSYLEGATVAEAVRRTLEESGVQFVLWGGGAEPLGLYVGDLRKGGLAPASRAPSVADVAAMSREDRQALRDQVLAERAEAAPPAPVEEAVPDDTPPPDSFGALAAMAGGSASAAVEIGKGQEQAQGASGSPGTAARANPGQPIAGMPPPVRGAASWKGEDGQIHSTGYTIQGDTVVYDDPNFVSFKNSPEARARRMNMDVSTLP